MQKVEIAKIVINERKRSSKDIKELTKSIKKLGLLNPITLNKNLSLIAGFHRLEAYKELGFIEIPAIIIDVDNLTAELAEIDENLIRTPLTVLENAEQLKRRKEIYEFLNPESKSENIKAENLPKRKDFVSEKPTSFIEDTAQKIGKSPRSVQQDIQIANNISDEVKQEIKGSDIENKKSQLLELAKVKEPEKQKAIVRKIKSGKVKNVKSFIQKISHDEPDAEIIISVEVYEKVKFALDEAEYELDLVKKENEQIKTKNQELEVEVQELKRQLFQEKKGELENEITENTEKIDYTHRKVLVDNDWLELPPEFEMIGKTHEQMYWVANNYSVNNKQKELLKTTLKK